MSTPARIVQSANCPPAAIDLSALSSQIPRQRDGGSLYSVPDYSARPALPFELTVSDWQDLPSSYTRGVGLTETAVVRVEDEMERHKAASTFVFRKIVPESQLFATSVDMMPPLGTRVNGFNTYMARKLAQKGIHSRIIGTNQARGHSMLHDTQATLLILEADDKRNFIGGATCTPNASVDLGYSMGQMKAFAKQVLAPAFGRTILFNKGIDPCVAEATSYRELITRDMLAYFAADAALVPQNLVRNAQETGVVATAARSRHWLGTVGLSSHFVSNTYDKWRTILTGEAGTFIGAAPTDTPVVLHSFNGSQLNHRDVFEAQMSDFSNARFVHEEGRHLSAACATVVGNLAADMALSLELIEGGASKSDIVDASNRPLLVRR